MTMSIHTYSIAAEKVLTVVLKGLIKLPSKTIINDLKAQGLNPLTCTEIPAPTRYPIYRITFAPGTTLTKINHVRFVQNLKIYWEKFDSRKPTIQCYRCHPQIATKKQCVSSVLAPTTLGNARKQRTPHQRAVIAGERTLQTTSNALHS